jgi:hypothetical protein
MVFFKEGGNCHKQFIIAFFEKIFSFCLCYLKSFVFLQTEINGKQSNQQ